MASSEHIVVLGMGYVGLPLAIMLAKNGYRVTGVDVNDDILAGVKDGVLPITEKELLEHFQDPAVSTNLTTSPKPVPADVFVISVATPLDERKLIADLSQVRSALESILPVLRKGNLIIIESTIPPLTCRELIAPTLRSAGFNPENDVYLAHCPERILPGDIFSELVNNSRIIGGFDPKASELAAKIYGSFVCGRIHLTDDVTAELVKLMENTYRDVNIALANEFAAVAEGLGVDIMHAISLANEHPRVSILRPGIGTGGHCIPVDPWFIKQVDPRNTRLIYTARMINEAIPERIATKVRQALRDIPNPKIVAIGLAYKPNTDDVRNSPAVRIIDLLQSDGYDVRAFDPLVRGRGYGTIEEVAKGADCLLVLVEHDVVTEELANDPVRLKSVMRTPLIMRFYRPRQQTVGFMAQKASAGFCE